MLRKLGFVVMVLGVGLPLPLWAARTTGAISGCVRNSAGAPQMGAVVEVLRSAAQAVIVFTDENGIYSASNLLPGTYSVKVSAPSYLSVLRDRVAVNAGTNVLIDLTLRTLFEAIQWAPPPGAADGDDWKWVLRSGANRPILRMVGDKSVVLTSESKVDSRLTGSLSFLAGYASEGFGSASDVGAGFSVEKSIFDSDTIGLRGNVGYGTASPANVLRASFSHKAANGAGPEIAFTMRNLPAPDTVPGAGMQVLSLETSDGLKFGDALELRFGSELQTIQFLGRVTTYRPFGRADLHLSPHTVIEYRYATSVPDDWSDEGFDSPPGEASQSGPRVSMVNYDSAVESAHHHELSLSRQEGKSTLEVAAYYDRVANPALTGVGEFSSDGGDVLPDLYSGTFTFQGNGFATEGLRLVAERELVPGLTATFDYGYGGALELTQPDVTLPEAHHWIQSKEHHAAAGKLSGVIPRSKTHWVASYRWVDGPVLTPVDMFNASAGRADPFLNIMIRQPIPWMGFFPGHVEMLLDVRNLLAQGYVPVLGQDHHTVYLVQSAKAVRGGVAFTF